MNFAKEVFEYFLNAWLSVVWDIVWLYKGYGNERFADNLQVAVVCASIAFFTLIMHHFYQLITDFFYLRHLRRENKNSKILDANDNCRKDNPMGKT